MCILMNLIFIQKIHIVKDEYFQERSLMKNKENLETNEYVYRVQFHVKQNSH